MMPEPPFAFSLHASASSADIFPASRNEGGLFFHAAEPAEMSGTCWQRAFSDREQNCDAAGPSPFALEVSDLHFAYGRRTILHDITLQVGKGEVAGLLGPNGCGKTTLFRCAMGLLRPEQGRISINGVDITHTPPEKLARHVAYVPQEHRQPFPFSAFDMVLMGRTPHIRGRFFLRQEDKETAREAMQRMGILDLSDCLYRQLSGGQKQLVLLARALAQQTPVILLDEPTSALDFSNQISVWKALRELASNGTAVLVCCHDPNHILWFCDHVSVMSDGRIIADGRPQPTLSEEVLQNIYGPHCLRLDAGNIRMVCPNPSLFD